MDSASLPAAENGVPALELAGIGRQFGGVRALAAVDLRIEPGERRAILGPNGAGKTTLFNVVSGEIRATSGTIALFGRDVTRLSPQKRVALGLARTFQTSRLFGGLSVADNLYLAVSGVRPWRLMPLRGLRRDTEIRERVMSVAQSLGLGSQLFLLAAELSHGEQRQLEVAMALASEPRLILLDEPAAGLSRRERLSLKELLLQLDPGLTQVLIEHDMDVALRVSERVTVLHEGQIVAEGTGDEIRRSDAVQRLYLGQGGKGA